MAASSVVQHLVSGNCLEVKLEWEFKVALKGDVHSSVAEGAKIRSLQVSISGGDNPACQFPGISGK